MTEALDLDSSRWSDLGHAYGTDCPRCKMQLYVRPKGKVLEVSTEDPVTYPAPPPAAVIPGPRPDSAAASAYASLDELANAPGLDAMKPLLPYLFGTAVCPGCGESFSLIDRLVEEAV